SGAVTFDRRQAVSVLRALVVAAVLVATWVAFVAFVWVVRPDNTSLADATRLLPDSLRLVRRVATARTIAPPTRAGAGARPIYLASPIDLVPDFLPVIGYADDVIVTSFVLRHVMARAGPATLRAHWPGSPEGLAPLTRILRLPTDE